MRSQLHRKQIWALVVVLAMSAIPANAASLDYYECDRDLGSGNELNDCLPRPYDSTDCFDLGSKSNLQTADGKSCKLQFWTHGGKHYLADELPATICLKNGPNATAWYSCTNPNESGSASVGNSLIGINASDGEYVAGRFVEAVDPASAIGSCATDANPCTTSDKIKSATAKNSVGLLGFAGWLHGTPGHHKKVNPSSPDVAFFHHKPDHPCNALSIGPGCYPIAWEPQLYSFEDQWVEVPRICQFVATLEGCPGCGLEGQCAPWTFRFRTDAFAISLVEFASGKFLARAKQIGDGVLELRFTAKNAERPGEGFAFRFEPIKGMAEPGQRLAVGIELEVGQQ